jgi:hypothetical protein
MRIFNLLDDHGVANYSTFPKERIIRIGNDRITIDVSQFTGIRHSMGYKDIERLKGMIALQRQKGYFALGSDSIEYIVMHEYGHAIDAAVGFAKSKVFKDLLKKYKANGDEWIATNLSSYGVSDLNRDASELIAEAFAEYMTSPNPRQIASEVGEALEKYFKLNYKSFKIRAAEDQSEMPKQTIPFVFPDQLKKYI